MKKIIGGKKYDTETATEVGSYSNGGGWSDFRHLEETLYRKRSGEFFLFGKGGPMTQYAEFCGQNQWCGGKKIIPLSWDSACEWAETHMDADEYEEVFGEVSEDDSRQTIAITLAASTIERVRREAGKQGSSISAYIESCVLKENGLI